MSVIAVIPTRGLVFARTINSIKDECDYIIQEGEIPEVQNSLVKQALAISPDHVWFIEDDMEVPDGTLQKMVNMDKAVVTVDYPVDNCYSVITRKKDEILWCGLGCTLVKRAVLEALGEPWFDTSYSWRLDSENPLRMTKIDNPYKYGGLDVNFGMRVRELGYEIHQLPGVEAKHLRCNALDKGNTNNGKFEITNLALRYQQIYKE